MQANRNKSLNRRQSRPPYSCSQLRYQICILLFESKLSREWEYVVEVGLVYYHQEPTLMLFSIVFQQNHCIDE